MLKAEHQQEQRVRENAANCEQLKSELGRIQQRQRELDMQKGARPKERMVTGSKPESRMEVDEAPRSKGRFNLDRAAQEHMNEGLEVWIPTESTSSLRGLETPIDGCRTAGVYSEFNPEQQSGERQLVTPERIQRETTTKKPRESGKSGATPDLEGATD